jgi:hypothetical protein
MDFVETQNAIPRFSRRICVQGIRVCCLSSLVLAPLCASTRIDQSRWSLYALGGFSIALPSTPLIQSGQGAAAGYQSWSAIEGEDPYVFSLTKVSGDAMKSPPDALLAQCVAGIIAGGKGQITGERDILLGGWPGVELQYRQENGAQGQLRAYVVKDEIVNLVVTHPLGSTEPPGVSKYFGSLKLPNDIEKGPLSQPGPTLEKFDLESSGFSAKVPRGAKFAVTKIGEGVAAVNMHRFAIAYLNRIYMGIVFDPPSGASKDLDADTTGKPAQAVNATIAGFLHQAILTNTSKDTPSGKDWIADFDAGHGLIGHLETYIRNNHTYTLLAVVPGPMLQSDEVQGFFSSVTLPAKR